MLLYPTDHKPRSWLCCRHAPRGCQLMLLLMLWFFLLLLLHMPNWVRGHEVMTYDILSSQERVQASLEIDGEVPASGRGLKLFVTISDGARRTKEQKGPQSGGIDDSFDVSRLAIEVTAYQQNLDGIEIGVSQKVWDSEGFMEIQEGEEEDLSFDPFWPASTEHKSKESTFSCFSSTVSNLMRHAFIEAMPSAGQSVKQHPAFQGSSSSVPNVAIIPPFLEWGPQSLFSPSLESLTVLNTCNSSGLHVFQPFSTNSQFSMFGLQGTTVPPGGMLSIPVVFLPTSLGVVEGLLVVQTSAGGFLVQVRGEGINSPYQLRPLSGLSALLGAKLQHPIIFHNPYDEPLRVEEVYVWISDNEKRSMPISDAGIDRGKGVVCKRDAVLSEDGAMGWTQLLSDGSSSSNFKGVIVELKPSGDWTIGPHSSNPIVDLELTVNNEGPVMGTLCMRVSHHLKQMSETVILPLRVRPTKGTSTSGKVYPVPEVLDFGVLSEKEKSKQAIVLVNPGPDFIRVERIFTSYEDSNIIAIEYADGLILHPGKESQVASITYAGAEERTCWLYNRCYATDYCQLVIQTNGTDIKLPYRAVVLHGPSDCLYLDSSSAVSRNLANTGENVCLKPRQHLQLQNGFNVPLVIIRDLEKRAWALESEQDEQLEETVNQDVVSGQSVLETLELLFSMVQVATEEIQWVTVSNPSDHPVKMQLLVSSEAGASHCKNEEGSSDVNRILGHARYATGPRPDTITMEGNKGTAIRSGIFSVAEGGVADAVVQPKSKATFGPIVFRPVERCVWTSLLMIRNNLTRLEWMPLQGTGGSPRLTFLDGDAPVQVLQLDFNMTPLAHPLSAKIKQHIHELIDHAAAKSACNKRVTREFLAKNTGEMPLQVESMTLTGGACDSHGFSLDSCDGFYLAPGQATQLFISYQPDFTGVFSRELHVSTSLGMLTVPLKANLAADLLPFCQKPSFFLKFEKLLLQICLIALFSVLIIFIKMLKQERLSATDPGRWPPSSNTKLFSPVELKISRKGKDCGRQRQKSVDPSSPTRSYAHASSGSSRARNYFRVYATVRNFVGIIKSVSYVILSHVKVKISKVEPPDAGLAKSNACHTKQANSGVNNGNKLAERKGSPAQVGNHLSKALLHSPAPMNVNQGSSKASGTNVAAAITSTVTESCQQQQLPATMSSSSVPGPPPSPPRTEAHTRQTLTPQTQSTFQKSQQVSSKAGFVEEKKEKGKRKKKKNNVSTLKQEVENGSRSGNSSPVSSPPSPATPINISRPASPFLPSDSLSNATSVLIGASVVSSHKRNQSHGCINSDGSTQLDRYPASDLPLKSIDTSCTVLQKQGSPVTNTTQGVPAIPAVKDRGQYMPVKDWAGAGAARKTVAASTTNYAQDSDMLLGSWDVGRIASYRPVLTTCATFPGVGRSSGWNVSTSQGESKQSMNVSMSNPSFVTSPVVTPIGRAPGTRLGKQCLEKPESDLGLTRDSGSIYSGRMASYSIEQNRRGKVKEADDFVYDIWGDHFAEISRGSRYTGLERYAALEGTFLSQACVVEDSQSLFAKSGFMGSTSSSPLVPPRSSMSPPDSSLSVYATTDSLFASHRLSPLLSDWIPEQ